MRGFFGDYVPTGVTEAISMPPLCWIGLEQSNDCRKCENHWKPPSFFLLESCAVCFLFQASFAFRCFGIDRCSILYYLMSNNIQMNASELFLPLLIQLLLLLLLVLQLLLRR